MSTAAPTLTNVHVHVHLLGHVLGFFHRSSNILNILHHLWVQYLRTCKVTSSQLVEYCTSIAEVNNNYNKSLTFPSCLSDCLNNSYNIIELVYYNYVH